MELPLFKSESHTVPLAHRLRPQSFADFVGQEHLLGPQKFLTQLLESPFLPSLILWGPPGTGKTTLAHLIAKKRNCEFVSLSAVSSGIKELKQIFDRARENLKLYNKKTTLFIDEIHRFNKAQQDVLLPHVEDGTLVLIGATTENPSFEINSPLLSRSKVLVLNKLTTTHLEQILYKLLVEKKIAPYAEIDIHFSKEARDFLCESADGDARRFLNTFENAVFLKNPQAGSRLEITVSDVEQALQKKSLLYDKKAEEHYNIISAFIKSLRGSDPNAALYYLARMLEAGEDPLFICRRMIIFASEDIGNADPQALLVATATQQSFHFIGLPEGWIPLAQCATYLAGAPKSNASYSAYKKAKADVLEHGSLDVPFHLRNAPTELLKNLGYGRGYQYAHDNKDHIVDQQHLPDKLKDRKYYEPDGIGYEKKIMEWLDSVKKSRRQ